MQRQGSSSTRSGSSGGGYQNLREKIISLGLEIEDRQKLKQTLQFKVEEGKWIWNTFDFQTLFSLHLSSLISHIPSIHPFAHHLFRADCHVEGRKSYIWWVPTYYGCWEWKLSQWKRTSRKTWSVHIKHVSYFSFIVFLVTTLAAPLKKTVEFLEPGIEPFK